MAIDEDLLKRARKMAIDKDTTLSNMIRGYLKNIVKRHNRPQNKAAQRLLQLTEEGLKQVGNLSWKRDSLHGR